MNKGLVLNMIESRIKRNEAALELENKEVSDLEQNIAILRQNIDKRLDENEELREAMKRFLQAFRDESNV